MVNTVPPSFCLIYQAVVKALPTFYVPSDVKALESTMQGKFIRRQQNKSHSTYQHALARHTPFHLHCPCPGDFPQDSNHWSVAVTVQRETVCLCRTHPAHLVLGCRRIWLNISVVMGQGMPLDLFWPPALLHEKTTWSHLSEMGVQVITNKHAATCPTVKLQGSLWKKQKLSIRTS